MTKQQTRLNSCLTKSRNWLEKALAAISIMRSEGDTDYFRDMHVEALNELTRRADEARAALEKLKPK
jgi:hypothetical protein